MFHSAFAYDPEKLCVIIPPLPEGGGGYTVLPLFVCPSKIFFVAFFSVTVDGRNLIFGHKLHIDTPYRGKRFWTHQIPTSCLPILLIFHTHWTYMHIFRRIFLNNYWWQESDCWSQAAYRYAILWEAFLDPSDSYFLFSDLVGLYTHWTYMHIFRHIFLSNYWWQRSDIWSQASYKYPISWEAFLDPSDVIHIEHICTFFVTFFSATIDGRNLIFGHKLHIYIFIPPLPEGGGGVYCFTSVRLSFRPSKIFFSATIDGRNLIFGHKLHIGTPYCGRRFWTHQIPTSYLPILLIFIHIKHTFVYQCTFFVTFF